MSGAWEQAHWTLSRGVASGAIVPSSLPETLLCQAFYNPAIIMIVEALLDPKALGNRPASPFSGDDGDGLGMLHRERRSGAGCEDGTGGDAGAASFLAQIAPPKTFFTHSILSGNKPTFRVQFFSLPLYTDTVTVAERLQKNSLHCSQVMPQHEIQSTHLYTSSALLFQHFSAQAAFASVKHE